MSEPDDLWAQMEHPLQRGTGFVLATVISTSSSAPRPTGTQMAILDDGSVVGSVSGGCVESDVYARAEIVRETGEAHLQRYGYSDESAFSVGLVCGGSIDVFLERVEGADLAFYRELAELVNRGESVAILTAVSGTEVGRREFVGLGDESVAGPEGTCRTVDEVQQQASRMLREHRSGVVGVLDSESDGESTYFVRSYGAPAHMIVFGSNSFAAALVRLAKLTGYYVTVCDARATFTTQERFPETDELVVQWPHRYLDEHSIDNRTVICVLTHDAKFDDPLLQRALGSNAGFIGAMGSRRTTNERFDRLRGAGVSERELARLRAPFGLDLGAKTPEETAVSMIAEIISVREVGSNRPLALSGGPIHHSVEDGSVSHTS